MDMLRAKSFMIKNQQSNSIRLAPDIYTATKGSN